LQVTGTIVDAASGDPLIGATVMFPGSNAGTLTDVDGKFSLKGTGDALEISYLGYNTTTIVNVEPGDLGLIKLEQVGVGLSEVVVTGVMDIVQDRKTPVAVSTIDSRVIQAKAVGNVEFPEVMKNTPSVYVSNQTGFGDSQMFLRGFDQTNTAFLLNGQPINGMEDGRMYWSNWSGMSDVANLIQIQRGLGSSKLAISSVGGTVNIVTKTTEVEQGGFARFMVGNDSYLKGTVSYNSGLQGKWAYSLLLDHWQGERKYGEGTRGQGQNYFFSVGYKANEKNSFNFLVTGAPQWHGQQWSQKEEDLIANPKFNQHWGMDGDDWQTERRNFYHKPVFNLSWENEMSAKSTLSSVLYASFGRGGGTGPYGSSSNRIRTDAGQVDFTAIRGVNTADADGIGDFGGNYALRGSMNNHQWYGNVTSFNHKLSEQLTLNVGADLRFYTGDHFRQLIDMFGLNGWQDSFRHATRGSDYVVEATFKADPWAALTNFAKPEDRIAYDYSETINYQGLFSQVEYSVEKFTAFVQGALSNQSYQREGRWADQGKSDKVAKIGYNLKGGASYSFNNANTVFVNVGQYSRQPFLDNVFENIRYSNDFITPDVENENIFGFEAGYKFGINSFNANVNYYNTKWGNRTIVSTFTNNNGTEENEEDDFTQRDVERGIEQVHTGFEIDLQYSLDFMDVRAHTTIGDWTYNEIGSITAFNDDTGAIIAESAGQDISGVHITNAPQFAVGGGLNFKVLNGLTAYVDVNYFAENYRRDRNFDSAIVVRSDVGTLDPYTLTDAGLGYGFKLGENYASARFNVYNVFNKFYFDQTDPFGSLIGNGRTWNASLKYSF